MIQRLIAFILFILISPILTILYIWVKLDSVGPFVFRQLRLGKDKKPFWLYKIRTMKVDAEKLMASLMPKNEADGPVFKIKNDPRFTKTGRTISHMGLDETLQLINIVKGQMSFVGPRPLPIKEAKRIPTKYAARFTILPGITSLWVVHGTQHHNFDQWMSDDLKYVNNRSFLLDLEIISKSILLLLLMIWRQIRIKN